MSKSSIEQIAVNEYYANYEDGADYVLYKISKELQISSKDIRLSSSSIRQKTEQLAQRIIAELCNGEFKESNVEKIQSAIDAVKNGPVIGYDFAPGKDLTTILIHGEQAETVLKVLQKELERQKGCGWCNKYKMEFHAVDNKGNTITVGDNDELGGECDVCPVCGKELKEATE